MPQDGNPGGAYGKRDAEVNFAKIPLASAGVPW